MSLPGIPQVEASHLEPSGPEPVNPQQFRKNLRLDIKKAHSEIIFSTLTHESNTKHTKMLRLFKEWSRALDPNVNLHYITHQRPHCKKKKNLIINHVHWRVLILKVLFKCKWNERDTIRQTSESLEIIWEQSHDPRIQKLCDFGL